MFIEFHDNPDRINMNDSNQAHNVGVVQIFHQVCKSISIFGHWCMRFVSGKACMGVFCKREHTDQLHWEIFPWRLLSSPCRFWWPLGLCRLSFETKHSNPNDLITQGRLCSDVITPQINSPGFCTHPHEPLQKSPHPGFDLKLHLLGRSFASLNAQTFF